MALLPAAQATGVDQMQHHTRVPACLLPALCIPDRQPVVLFYRWAVPPHLDGSLGCALADAAALIERAHLSVIAQHLLRQPVHGSLHAIFPASLVQSQ
jgi:hypothetical protein